MAQTILVMPSTCTKASTICDDEHNQADHQDRAGLEHVELGSHAEHGQRKEERGGDTECHADRAEVVDHEDRAQGEAHQCGVHIEHDARGGRLHLGDAHAEHHGQGNLHHAQADEAHHAGGHEEAVVGSGDLAEHGDHGGDEDADGHLAVHLGH